MIIWNCKLTKSGKDHAGAKAFVRSLKSWNGINLEIEDCMTNQEVMPSTLHIPIYTLSRSKGLEADFIIYIRDQTIRRGLEEGVKYDHFIALSRAREQVVVFNVLFDES